MLRQRLGVIVAFLAACGGSVDPAPPPAPATVPTYAGPFGTVTGLVDVHRGTNIQDAWIEPVATSVLLFPIQKPPTTRQPPTGEVVAKTESNADGAYSITAPPGVYTLLVLYEGDYERLTWNAEGWSPVHVEVGKTVTVNVRVERNRDY
jgi:hypothetical protein